MTSKDIPRSFLACRNFSEITPQIRKSLFLVFFLKLTLALWIPVFPDEAYYWVWSKNLALSYFDHPPMIAYLLYLGELLRSLFPTNFPYTDGLVRLPGIVLSQFTLVVLVKIYSKYVSSNSVLLFTWILAACPLIGVGSIIMTPDIPVIFFWVLSAFIFLELISKLSDQNSSSKSILKYFLILGVSLGLGFLSKYHIVLMVPIFIAALFFDRQKFRFVENTKIILFGVALTICSGLLTCLPVIFWNFQRDWISFKFQINHGLGANNWEPEWTLTYLLGQVFILFPPLIVTVWKFCRKAQYKTLVLLALFPWGFFLFSSFKGVVEANWPIVGFPFLLMSIVGNSANSKMIKGYFYYHGVILLIFFGIFIYPGIVPYFEKLYEPKELMEVAKDLDSNTRTFGSSYQISASLWFQKRVPIYKVKGSTRFDFFDLQPESVPKSEFLLVRQKDQWPNPETIRDYGNPTLIKEFYNYEILKYSKK